MIDHPLYFSRSERRLILTCSMIIIVAGFIPYPRQSDNMEWECLLESHLEGDTMHLSFGSSVCEPCDTIPIGQMNRENWIALGAKPWIADRINKYRSSGGSIKVQADLLKIFGIDSSWVYQVSGCIIWEQPVERVTYPFRQPKIDRIDINSADSLSWVNLKGIGPVLASRIIKFREKLGGFYAIDQLRQVYGLPDSTFEAIKPSLIIKSMPRPIYVNLWSFEELAEHLLISKKEAGIIIRYRKQHGPYHAASDLMKIVSLDSQRLSRWLPYVDFRLDTLSGRHGTVPLNEGLHFVDH